MAKIKHAPLVEALVELRWAPKSEQGADSLAPDYSLLVGRLYDLLKDEYPYHELTPHAAVPAEMAVQMNMVQHQLRAEKQGWPLVQLGPTIFTVNETEGYDWEGDFRKRAIEAIDFFLKAYQESENPAFTSLLLRYIDAIEFDWEREALLGFLQEDLKTRVGLPCELFNGARVGKSPNGLDLRLSFPCKEPPGMAHLRFATGQSRGKKALIMETMVQSVESDVPELPGGFADWLDAAHKVTSAWFGQLTAGRLHEKFSRG